MDPVLSLLGPIAGAIFGMGTFFVRRQIIRTEDQLVQIARHLEEIAEQINELRVQLPTNYVSKEQYAQSVKSQEAWRTDLSQQLQHVREEVVVLRSSSIHSRYG